MAGETVDTDGGAGRVPDFLAQPVKWAARRDDELGVALVGSHARGTARPNSDVVILAEAAWRS
jgi:predicted nucleotidyltransferase